MIYKTLVFGASGILGQAMRLQVPAGVEPIWYRREADILHRGVDVTDLEAVAAILVEERPAAIVNLAGESRVDVVEQNPSAYFDVNVGFPIWLARYCASHGIHYVHVSSQAVFDGKNPPYHSKSQRNAVNQYGQQKIAAEQAVERCSSHWTIARPTFVLGIRPLPLVGRQNPMEQILAEGDLIQVADRFFSVAFAVDVAHDLWTIATGEPLCRAVNLGIPATSNRYQLANKARGSAAVKPATHGEFERLAPRPLNTTYEAEAGDWRTNNRSILHGIEYYKIVLKSQTSMDSVQRAREISLFTGIPVNACVARLERGFGFLHNEVTKDFNTAFTRNEAPATGGITLGFRPPESDDELLVWYRSTNAYIYELSAYHCDPGFNYSGMCRGIIERLPTLTEGKRVLCLGDGIGDLTLDMMRSGFDAIYHDLAGSRTAAFAKMRMWMYTGKWKAMETVGWRPDIGFMGPFDAIVSLDFLEHVKSVPLWTHAIYDALKPGGIFVSQNAFAIGSGPDGSMPMHLAENDRFEKDWDPLLFDIGFEQIGPQWYRKKWQKRERLLQEAAVEAGDLA